MNCRKHACTEKYFIQTFGCQMNVHDSEVMSGLLEQSGYERASAPEEADLILLNTCCVRENAENRLYGHLGNLKAIKDQRPETIIGVCGCMAQQTVQQERIREKFPYIDLVFGTHNLHRLPELIQQIKQTGAGRLFEVWTEGERAEDLPVRRDNPYQAWVNIIYGCNNFCTYCIVPYVRGREKSRRPEKILAEVERLAKEGVKEVTLLGQNVNSYGQDFPPAESMDFPDLLAKINKIDGISRIRFQTSHPKDLSDKLIQEMAEGEKICEHIHLPVQAGSDKILAAMNRKYTRDHYLNLIRKLRAAIPEIMITTDLIVGFPGEEEADFLDTLNLVQEVGYDGAFTFAYSPRTGTKAASLPGQVEEEVKMERLQRLIEVTNSLAKASNLRQVGKVEKILVEGPSEKRPEIYSGRTRGNKLVLFDPTTHSRIKRAEDLIGKEISVYIEEGLTYTLKGRIVE
ncbi:MAG TPA: tRNA (N6-isopentenyl adenosine(37)-C2)-methylthiotransferase MiaB [Bacillota bacterium]